MGRGWNLNYSKEWQNGFGALNTQLDGLQQLAEQLDPMEMAYGEVRFLDVDFEQLEREYGDVVAGMGAELDHEKGMATALAQMEREIHELEGQIPLEKIESSVPELKAKLAKLKGQDAGAKNARKFVARANSKPSLEEMGERIERVEKKAAEMVGAIQKEKADKFVQKMESILQKAEVEIPPEQELAKYSDEMQQQMPLTDARAEQLLQRMEELKWKRKRKEAIQSKIDANLEQIGQKIDELLELAPVSMAKKGGGKKKKKKAKQKVEGKEEKQQPRDRDEQIHELKKAIEHLESGILPALNALQNEAIQENIPMEAGPEQKEQTATANELVHSLKVGAI